MFTVWKTQYCKDFNSSQVQLMQLLSKSQQDFFMDKDKIILNF